MKKYIPISFLILLAFAEVTVHAGDYATKEQEVIDFLAQYGIELAINNNDPARPYAFPHMPAEFNKMDRKTFIERMYSQNNPIFEASLDSLLGHAFARYNPGHHRAIPKTNLAKLFGEYLQEKTEKTPSPAPLPAPLSDQPIIPIQEATPHLPTPIKSPKIEVDEVDRPILSPITSPASSPLITFSPQTLDIKPEEQGQKTEVKNKDMSTEPGNWLWQNRYPVGGGLLTALILGLIAAEYKWGFIRNYLYPNEPPAKTEEEAKEDVMALLSPEQQEMLKKSLADQKSTKDTQKALEKPRTGSPTKKYIAGQKTPALPKRRSATRKTRTTQSHSRGSL